MLITEILIVGGIIAIGLGIIIAIRNKKRND